MSLATGVVKPGTIPHTGFVSIAGTARVGKTLAVRQGTFKAGPVTVNLTYQWLANGR